MIPFQDEVLYCDSCGKQFIWTIQEQMAFHGTPELGKHHPDRCPARTRIMCERCDPKALTPQECKNCRPKTSKHVR